MQKSIPWMVAAMFAAVAAVAWATHEPLTTFAGQEKGDVGRYYLFQGTVGYTSGEAIPAILRVDSQTGKTGRYMPPVDDREYAEGWLELPDIIDKNLIDQGNRFLP